MVISLFYGVLYIYCDVFLPVINKLEFTYYMHKYINGKVVNSLFQHIPTDHKERTKKAESYGEGQEDAKDQGKRAHSLVTRMPLGELSSAGQSPTTAVPDYSSPHDESSSITGPATGAFLPVTKQTICEDVTSLIS